MFGNIKKNWCVISMVQDFSNRHLHLGGSDSNTILKSSKFKSVQQLMYEKAQILENTFDGNVYTLIGDLLENRIQEVMGFDNVDEIEYEKEYNGIPFKCHIDGLSKNGKTILEIKVANKKDVEECYEEYEWQTRTYMYCTDKQETILCLLKRDGKLKEIANECIEKYIPRTNKYKLEYLHSFENYENSVKTNCELFLRDKLKDFEITRDMLETKTIKRDKKKEKIMLERLELFWYLKQQLEEDPFLYKDEFFEWKLETLQYLSSKQIKQLKGE